MNKLSKVLVFLFILFSFIACVLKKPISHSHTYYIVNETDKHIFAQADYKEKNLPVTKTISIQGKTDEPVFLFTKADLIPAPRWRGSVTRANISIHIANNKVTYE
jgi:hypothetical protein